MKSLWEQLEAAHAASSDGGLSAAGCWDNLAAFAASMGMDFPAGRREEILANAARVALEGSQRGATVRVRGSVSLAKAWKSRAEYLAPRTSKDGLKAFRADRKAFGQVARLHAAIGSVTLGEIDWEG